jgi:hypothetical protein
MYGPYVPFCMPNRIDCIPLVSAMSRMQIQKPRLAPCAAHGGREAVPARLSNEPVWCAPRALRLSLPALQLPGCPLQLLVDGAAAPFRASPSPPGGYGAGVRSEGASQGACLSEACSASP